jgi:DnaJ-class molecular chaperone
MPDKTDLNPGENLRPACNGSGKKGSQKCEQCTGTGTGKVMEGIGGA